MGQRLSYMTTTRSSADGYTDISEDSFLAPETALDKNTGCYSNQASGECVRQQKNTAAKSEYHEIYLELKDICKENPTSENQESSHKSDGQLNSEYTPTEILQESTIMPVERTLHQALTAQDDDVSTSLTNTIIEGNFALARENIKKVCLQPSVDTNRAMVLDRGSQSGIPKTIIRQQTSLPSALRHLIKRAKSNYQKGGSTPRGKTRKYGKENNETASLLY